MFTGGFLNRGFLYVELEVLVEGTYTVFITQTLSHKLDVQHYRQKDVTKCLSAVCSVK